MSGERWSIGARARRLERRDEERTPTESFSRADLFAPSHFTCYLKNDFAIGLPDFAQEPAKLLQNRCVLARTAPRVFVGRLPYAKSRRLRGLVAFVEKQVHRDFERLGPFCSVSTVGMVWPFSTRERYARSNPERSSTSRCDSSFSSRSWRRRSPIIIARVCHSINNMASKLSDLQMGGWSGGYTGAGVPLTRRPSAIKAWASARPPRKQSRTRISSRWL